MADSSLTPQVVAAFAGLGGVLLGSLISWGVQAHLLGRRIQADENLAERKFKFDKELAERKFAYDKALTEQKLQQDRENLVHKRRFDLAESLLSDAYRFRDAMGYARTDVSFDIEGESRNASENEPNDLKRTRDRYFVPIERLQKQSEFINGFLAKQHTALAHFGPDVSHGFKLLGESINEVRMAAQILIDSAGFPDKDPDFIQQMRGDLWLGYAAVRNKDDNVGKKVDEGVLLFENLCRPVLEWKGA
jgi:hypothetical protein